MKALISMILIWLDAHKDRIFVRENTTSYTFAEIKIKVMKVVRFLNSLSNEPIKVALVADNSINFIIIFLATIISGNHLILFTPRASRSKLAHVLIDSGVLVLVTSINTEGLKSYIKSYARIVLTPDEILQLKEDVCVNYNNRTGNEGSVVVYTSNGGSHEHLHTHNIMDTLRHKMGSCAGSYLIGIEMTTSFIETILVPLKLGKTIIISNSNSPFDNTVLLQQYKPEKFITTSYSFMQIYKEWIDSPLDSVLSFLSKYKLGFLKKRVLLSNYKKIIGDTRVVIANGPYKLPVPDYLMQYIGFILTIGYEKSDSQSITSEEMIISSIPYVKECVLSTFQGKDYIIVVINHDMLMVSKLQIPHIQLLLSKLVTKINNNKNYSMELRFSPTPLERDEYGNIKRSLYQLQSNVTR